MPKISIAVLSSGRGSNLQAVIDGVKNKEINGEIKVLITDNPEAFSIERAKKSKIPVEIVNRKNFKTREEMDLKIKSYLDQYKIDLVVLAGYMRIISSKELLDAYKYKIINIHPSLLPAFKGSMQAQHDAFEYGCKVSGLTIHFVTEDVDGGAIVFQKAVDISDCKSGDEASEKILKFEHESYKKVIDSFSKGTYKIEGKRAIFVPY